MLLAIATVSVAMAKKDAKPTLKPGEQCTFTNYNKGKCSYDEYKKYLDGQYPSRYRSTSPTTDYRDYRNDNSLDSLYDY